MTLSTRYGARMTDLNDDMNLETRKKRLLYRSNYRGFREADMILGGYAKAHIETMSEAEILMFEDLLNAKDHDIYAWVMETLPVPANYDTPLLERLRAFNPLN